MNVFCVLFRQRCCLGLVALYCPVNSAWVIEVAIVVCSFDDQDMTALPAEKRYPEVDLELFGQSL